MKIRFTKENRAAITPTVAYNGTSACFDLYSTELVVIPAFSSAFVPNGIRIIIPKGYYLRFNTRSSLGFINDLFVYPGILDESFTGNLDVKVYNFAREAFAIKKGEKYAQVEVLQKPEYQLLEIPKEEFRKIEVDIMKEGLRGADKCWGSSGR